MSKKCEIYSIVLVRHKGHSNARKFFNSETARSYDSVVRATTFGRDTAWKSQILPKIRSSKMVLDLASGTGILTSMIEKEHKGRAVGLDFTFEYLQESRRKMSFASVQATAEAIPYKDEAFDAVVSSYLAKYVDVNMLTSECWRVLMHGGIVVFHDFTCPQNLIMRCLWRTYFATLRIAGIFVRPWRAVFQDLDKVICESRWVDTLSKALQERGFEAIEYRSYTLGTAGILVARKT